VSDHLRARTLLPAIVVLAAAGIIAKGDRFFPAYLYAFLFWIGVPIGCLCLLMIQYLTGGRWGLVIRRILEAGTRTLPVMAVLFVPLVFGLRHSYVWARPESVTDEALRHILEHKRMYLNPGFFVARAVFYFAVWTTLMFFMNRWAVRLDAGRDRRIERRMRSVSGGGLVLMGLTITFSSIDWAMSLDPRWQSTIYGILFMVGNVLCAFAIAILAVTALRDDERLRSHLTAETTHDLGKLLLAFTMLWAYVHLSQFLIVWSANLPDEITWYMRRTAGVWGVLAFVVMVLQFALPFPMLLSRNLKRTPDRLARVAVFVLAGRMCDLFWIVAPAFDPPVAGPHILDAVTLVGIGGIWYGAFAIELGRRPLIPQHDIELEPAHVA
jgi:hypothetical protein